jgi:hypothetical protein
MSGITVTLSAGFSSAAETMVNSALDQAIQKLSAHFGFSPDEARDYLQQVSVQPELLTAKDLPFCGKRIPGCCDGIAFRNGLYTQCPKKPQQDGFCRACWTQKEETGSLKYGNIEDRLKVGPMEFAEGKVAPFARLMAKHGWTREYVESSAKALGWTVPEENFIVIKTKRERKPKTMETRHLSHPIDTDADDELKTSLVQTGVLPPAALSPSKIKVPENDELDEEPVSEPPPKPPAGEPAPTQETRKGRDYSALTTEEVPGLNPSTLRTACTHHGIEVEGKKPAALRVELINQLSGNR